MVQPGRTGWTDARALSCEVPKRQVATGGSVVPQKVRAAAEFPRPQL